jgi:NitT/TauT family transport system substrate-binding protein
MYQDGDHHGGRSAVTGVIAAGILIVAACSGWVLPCAAAEAIKIGTVKTASTAAVYIAIEKGYFAAAGLEPDLVNFDASEPIAVAAVSRDVDFGVTGLTGGLYSLAGQGALRIIAGQHREAPGFHSQAYLASNRAYEAGLKSPKDIAGHSFAITQMGSTTHYALGLLADKYGFDLKAMRLVPLTSISNMISATSGGQTDAMIATGTAALVPVRRGDAKLLGWVGDETPWQLGAVFTATATADGRRDTVERFLRAWRQATRDYHDAFTAADETRKDGPTAPEILAIIAKYTGQPAPQVAETVAYYDREGRLDEKDVLHQIAWYQAQHLLKGPIDAEALIDKRYAVALPEK